MKELILIAFGYGLCLISITLIMIVSFAIDKNRLRKQRQKYVFDKRLTARKIPRNVVFLRATNRRA